MAAGTQWSSASIHLDINGVVLGKETIRGETTPAHEYAQVILANGTYYTWDGEREESFKLFVWRVVHPGDNGDKELRAVRKAALKNFVTSLDEDHPLKKTVTKQYEQLRYQLEKSPIFPGLDRLLAHFSGRKETHRFVFRTFGGDGSEIAKHLREKFPDFHLHGGMFDKKGDFSICSIDSDGSFLKMGEAVADPEVIRNLFHTGHWVVHDSFEKWRSDNEACKAGKPLFFSRADDERVDVMLDDNLEIVSDIRERSIVAPYDVDSGRSYPTSELKDRLCKVNPIEAALDPDYLLNTVNRLLSPGASKKEPVA